MHAYHDRSKTYRQRNIYSKHTVHTYIPDRRDKGSVTSPSLFLDGRGREGLSGAAVTVTGPSPPGGAGEAGEGADEVDFAVGSIAGRLTARATGGALHSGRSTARPSSPPPPHTGADL